MILYVHVNTIRCFEYMHVILEICQPRCFFCASQPRCGTRSSVEDAIVAGRVSVTTRMSDALMGQCPEMWDLMWDLSNNKLDHHGIYSLVISYSLLLKMAQPK